MNSHSAQSPMQAVLERCANLGILSCTLSPKGTITQIGAKHFAWNTVLHSPVIASAIQRASLELLPKFLKGETPPTQVVPGLWMALSPHSDDFGLHGCVAMLFPDSSSAQSPALLEAKSTAGIPELDFTAMLDCALPYSTASTPAMSAVLRTAVMEVATARRSEEETEGFTKQLTGAFETIDLLYSLGRAMKAPFSPAEFLTSVCARARATLSFNWVAVSFGDSVRTPASLQRLLVADGDLPLDAAAFRPAISAAMQDSDTTCKVHTDLPALASKDNPQVITQPLLCKGHQIGVLVAGDKFGDDPMVTSYDTQLIEACSGFLSTFVENVALYDEQQELFVGTLHALTAAIDAKDRYTRGHSERVALLSRMLAHAAGMPESQCERIRIAGLVHDVGKIGVPEATLLKPGKLTDEEFAQIKKHPETGFEILHQVRLLSDVLPGVLHHHERYDGKGYPYGLSGTDIPFMARIIAVADTFDAMSSDRAYRSRMPRQKVLEEISRSAGSQLDPRLTQLMQKLPLVEYDAMAARHAAAERQAA